MEPDIIIVLIILSVTAIMLVLDVVRIDIVAIGCMLSLGWIKLSLKDGLVGMNVIGALIFGIGFAVLGYCPGNTSNI